MRRALAVRSLHGVSAPPQGPGSGETARRILVVDDCADTADSLAMYLRLLGHDVCVAHDGRSALEHATRDVPDVVILDIGLPGLSGYAVAEELRRDPRTRAALLVALTGWGHDEDRRRAREAGFDLHVVKPVDPDRLLRLVDQASGVRTRPGA